MCGPVRRVGGANWASFSCIWWVVVLTTWVGGGAGLDAGLAAQATPVERGIQLSTRLRCLLVVFWRGNRGGGGGSSFDVGGSTVVRTTMLDCIAGMAGPVAGTELIGELCAGGGCRAWRGAEAVPLLPLGHPGGL